MADVYVAIEGTPTDPTLRQRPQEKYRDMGEYYANEVAVGLPATLVHDQVVVTTHGTQVTLGASTALSSGIRVKALHANTGWIYVGDSDVSSANGYVLDAGEEVFMEVADLATVFVDSSVDGEGVSYIGS